MKFASIIAVVIAAFSTAQASIIPAEHHGRFLQERDQLEAELAAWKNSKAGQVARKNGYYVDKANLLASTASTHDEQLSRLFLTKLAIEEAQKQNPDAHFSVNSPFTLMTNDEFVKFVHRSARGFTAKRSLNTTAIAVHHARGLRAEATSKDWTTGKCVAAVKDQGQCGSCWAFSSVSVVESAYCLKHGSLTTLSEQELVSCDYQDDGCDGGLQSTGIGYIQGNGGVSTEDSYPYTSGETEQNGDCEQGTEFPVDISSSKLVNPSDASFVSAINLQPISVSVAAGGSVWKQYTGGVVSSCTTTELDHAVVIVGYDATSFKIRNSWGDSWGEDGYIRLKRLGATKAACSVINSDATYPVVA
jgi:cathepsin L